MAKICTDINQKDEMLFWLTELTHLSSPQAEAMLKKMHSESTEVSVAKTAVAGI